ncbi:hypothetical protein [Rhodococcus sp. SGAir0479]|uniref:hypothetical protein n=1 Tax=Rhodococcus sp. SGAir0479 TaxID=2567884 RepID=UPI0010CD1342|nr:hypothetical protein [Rhodococcus sp. SGAir0479]QCQ93248.1 hypothetical protein E7742_19845 [Rhodococcus sp. SGAir0479]
MNLIKKVAASALVTGAVFAGAGTAHADPPPAQQPLTKQQAFDNMLNELRIGWEQGGAQGAATGSAAGLGIGCLSMFPGSLAGCMIGGPTGAVIGGLVGIGNGNPKAQQAIETYLNTP